MDTMGGCDPGTDCGTEAIGEHCRQRRNLTNDMAGRRNSYVSNMAENGKDLLLHDPLSPETRKERRMLLTTSILAAILVKAGLVPTKISALGVDFSSTDQKILLQIVAVIASYFLLGFIIYASADFLAWHRARHAQLEEKIRRIARSRDSLEAMYVQGEEEMLMDALAKYKDLFKLTGAVSIIRAIFEFILPIFVGVYAIGLLLLHKLPAQC